MPKGKADGVPKNLVYWHAYRSILILQARDATPIHWVAPNGTLPSAYVVHTFE